MTKFNVTIRADEKTLGPLLASLPQDTVPEIVRLKEKLPSQETTILSPEQREAARWAGVNDVEYAKQLLKLRQLKRDGYYEPAALVRPVVNGGTRAGAKSDAKSAVLTDVLADMPAEFKGRDFRESLSRHKLSPVSANYYLRKLRQRKLIRSTGSHTAMRYYKIKKG